MATAKLMETKDYRMFQLFDHNRAVHLDTPKRKRLMQQMKLHGWIEAYPLYCTRDNGKLMVRDGQHRLAVAKELGLPVRYVVCNQEASIPDTNNTQVPWNVRSYIESYAQGGNADYQELLDFSKGHGLPLTSAVAILGNRCSTSPLSLYKKIRDGKFQIRDRAVANKIAILFQQLGSLRPEIKTRFFCNALFAVCLVKDFEPSRLTANAQRCLSMLIKYGDRDNYLDMLERIYNYGRSAKMPLKFLATEALRQRNPATRDGKVA